MSMTKLRKLIRERADEAEAWKLMDEEMGEVTNLSRLVNNKKAELEAAERKLADAGQQLVSVDAEVEAGKAVLLGLREQERVIRSENTALEARLLAEAEAKAEARITELQVDIDRVGRVLEQVNADVRKGEKELEAIEARKSGAQAVLDEMRKRLG